MSRILATLFLLSLNALAWPYGIVLPPGTTEVPEGVKSIRTFPTWESIQPKNEGLLLNPALSLLKNAQKNNSTIVGSLHQLTPWATENNTVNDFPLKNKDAWDKYTATVMESFHTDITHWDVLDSYNLLPRQTATPFHYVELLTIAHKNAQKLDPPPKIGFVIANYDVEFLDAALRDGAAGNFDYISLSPFPVHKEFGKESGFQLLTIGHTIHKLLESHKLEDIEIHITLTGNFEDLQEVTPWISECGFDKIFLDTEAVNISKIKIKTQGTPAKPNFADKPSVSITLGKTNTHNGIYQFLSSTTAWDEETQANRLRVSADPPQTQSDFLIDDTFVTPETRELEITVTAKRIDSEGGLGNPTGLNLTYESVHGYRDSGIFWTVPGENKWQTHTWKIKDAAFKSEYGWNIRLDAAGAGNDVLIKDITIKR